MLRTYQASVSIITGAASGIGRALAEDLARRGGEVVLADVQIELAREAAAKICAAGGKAQAHFLDVTDAHAVEALIQATAERAGRLDYVFNNAGIGVGGPIGLHTLEDWERVLSVNLRGVIHGVRGAYSLMRQQGFGYIINTASITGLIPTPTISAYSAIKHAVVGFSLALRAEVAAEGVRVSVLCPGAVRTAMMEGGGKYGKLYVEVSPEQQRLAAERMWPMPPEAFARQALNAVARNQAVIVLPSWWRIFWWLNRLSPALALFIMQKAIAPARKTP